MTEIPDHLLQRSRERRQALGLGGDDAGGGDSGGGDAGATPAPAAAAAPVPAAPAAAPEPVEEKPPPPPPPHVEAALRRKRVPVWALPVLVSIPLWAYLYQGTLEPPPAGENDPVALGQAIYAERCASCHGGGGGGGAGPALADGAVAGTFPEFGDHIQWVTLGSDGWRSEVGETYGATDKPVTTGMPGFGDTLSEQELAEVILYERVAFGGLEPEEELVAIAEGEAHAGGEEAGAE